MAELIFLGRSFYVPQNDLDIPYLKSCGFLRLQNAQTPTGPGIASILAVIREFDHAHFLTGFCSDKVNALWH